MPSDQWISYIMGLFSFLLDMFVLSVNVAIGWDCIRGTADINGPTVQRPGDTWVNIKQRWNDTDRENRTNRWKAYPTATLSTTNPTRLGANQRLRAEMPANNYLSYGTAPFLVSLHLYSYWFRKSKCFTRYDNVFKRLVKTLRHATDILNLLLKFFETKVLW
jgi:hypothetical protein